MKKYDLLRSDDSIIRVLEIQNDRIFVIDCIKHNMPVWRKLESLDFVLLESELVRGSSQCSGKEVSVCTDDELFEATGFVSRVKISVGQSMAYVAVFCFFCYTYFHVRFQCCFCHAKEAV